MAFVVSPQAPHFSVPSKSPSFVTRSFHLSVSSFSRRPIPTSEHRRRLLRLTEVSPAPELGAVEEKPEASSSTLSRGEEDGPSNVSGWGLEESVLLLKRAGKTRDVPPVEVVAALSTIRKAKVDSSSFLETLGGSESPGRTWMLIFTAQKRLDKGRYFPVAAVQRFDAAAKRIENGVYLGPIGHLTFEGKFSCKGKILAFMFEYLRLKIGPFGPLEISLGKQEREPTTTDAFFIWFYIDEEIAVAQGKGGGFAFWSRCHNVT
ncbi:hypothetical protein HPP92_000194 [Vanilla planifolia]|uniref:Microbial collagenase n=1 Tax=Vanilla planifolia TaxID=51239 RepID=A0A835VIH3_VANPL|nr:hypothetical protein HPP92_000194 [Vanilla planifolia]